MRFITELELSNFRRFGANVVMKFPPGPGVTVIVAPNGTGKTSIFEAIELALTGAVQRLAGENLSVLVREGKRLATVKARFGDSHVLASLALGSENTVTREGDPAAVLGAVPGADLKMLLRLTHLMDQSERRWFVRGGPEVGGESLAALPAIRDSLAASSALPMTRQALSNHLREARVAHRSAETNWGDWERSLQERDSARHEFDVGGDLKNLNVLHSELVEVARPPWGDPGALGPGESVPSLQAFANVLSERLGIHVVQLYQRLATLETLGELVKRHESLSREEREAKLMLAASRASYEVSLAALRDAEGAARAADEHLTRCRGEATNAHLQHDRFVAFSQARRMTATRQENRERAQEGLRRAQDALPVAEQRLLIAESTLSDVSRLRTREDQLRRSRLELTQCVEGLAQWTTSEIEREEINRRISLAREVLAGAAATVASCASASREQRTLVSELREELSGLLASADQIRASVVAITSSLPPDEGTCPVCLWPHGPSELQRRLHQALSTMSPAVVATQGRLHEAEGRLVAASDALRTAEKAQGVASEDLEALLARDRVLVDTISRIRQIPLLAGVERLAAAEVLEGEQAKLDEEARALQESVRGLQTESEVRAKHRAAIEDCEIARTRLSSAQSTFAEAEDELAGALRAVEELATMLGPIAAESYERVSLRVVAADAAVVDAVASRETQNGGLADARATLERAEHDLDRHAKAHAMFMDQLRETIAAWRSARLDGQPSDVDLREAQRGVETELTRAAEARARIDSTATELARWAAAEKLRTCETRVARFLMDGENEEACGGRLRKICDHTQMDVQEAESVSQAVTQLAEALKRRLESFHATVVAPVTPVQRALLRRMVRDRRFEKVGIAFQQHYNKQLAEADVPIHGARAPVGVVASEAQAVEVQLSFLLALALRHPWCEWRALLLDDPTQHHDLIHASAVFDVLRDFVAEHGFQVVFATHDVGQARFLVRKLRNDGLVTQAYALRSTADGVVARRAGLGVDLF